MWFGVVVCLCCLVFFFAHVFSLSVSLPSKFLIADNEKGIARAYREIERLEQQLDVSLLDYNHVWVHCILALQSPHNIQTAIHTYSTCCTATLFHNACCEAMFVSVQASRNHRRVTEEYQLEKLRADKEEGILKDRLADLMAKIKEEMKTQFLYEVC